MNTYHVYIMASASKVIYIGITGNLSGRVWQHKHKQIAGFTARYNTTKLVYFEETADVHAALEREKQLKGWARQKKLALIEAGSPNWHDLSQG